MKKNINTGRLTHKRLVEWLNEEFKRIEINEYEVVSAERTYHSRDAYEGGAARLIIWFKNKTMKDGSLMSRGHFLCFYSIRDLEGYMKNGHELYLRFKHTRFQILTDIEIEVRKIPAL